MQSAARWSSRGLRRKSLLVAVIFTRLLGNGTLGSPKWNKQINLVTTCRRTVSQVCLFFYLGLYNLYFIKLKSRVTLYRNARGKRALVEREVGYIWSLNMSRSRNVPSQKWERLELWRECHSTLIPPFTLTDRAIRLSVNQTKPFKR